MYIVTGANQKYAERLELLIHSIQSCEPEVTIIAFNLGIDQLKWQQIQAKFQSPKVHFRHFDFASIPSWMNIEQPTGRFERGAWAWKPLVIQKAVQEGFGPLFLWMDARNLVVGPLKGIKRHLQQEGVYSEFSSGSVQRWTHPDTLQRLGAQWAPKANRNAACIGFNLDKQCALELFNEWVELCKDPTCIAPEGSSRQNHRQDQAIFTNLYYKYQAKYKFRDYQTAQQYWCSGSTTTGYVIHSDTIRQS